MRKPFFTRKTPIEWLLDAEVNYSGTRCLLINNILEPGIFMSSRTIEKYLKTFISLKTNEIPLTHELLKLFDIVIKEGFLTNDINLRKNINYFDSIKNNVSYIDAPENTKKLKDRFSYGRCDIEKLDYIIFTFENILSNNTIIEGYSFPKTNLAIIRDIINNRVLPEDTVVYFKKKWILKDNSYFKIKY